MHIYVQCTHQLLTEHTIPKLLCLYARTWKIALLIQLKKRQLHHGECIGSSVWCRRRTSKALLEHSCVRYWYIYEYIYIYIYICMHACTHTYIHTWFMRQEKHVKGIVGALIREIWIHLWVYVHTYTHTHTYIYTLDHSILPMRLCLHAQAASRNSNMLTFMFTPQNDVVHAVPVVSIPPWHTCSDPERIGYEIIKKERDRHTWKDV